MFSLTSGIKLKKSFLAVFLMLGLMFTTSAADKATVTNKDSLMQGVWQFATIGKQGNYDLKAESLTQ